MPNINLQLNNWKGKFGQEYTDRNKMSLKCLEKLYENNYRITRTELNNLFLDKIDHYKKILEIGSNISVYYSILKKDSIKIESFTN